MKVKDHFLAQEYFDIEPTNTPGILKTNPIPADLEKYYESQEYISHHQDKGGIKEFIYKKVQQLNLNFKRNLLAKELFNKAKVLDYGCGAGEFLKFIESDFTTFGYEPNADARNFAAKKFSSTTIIDNIAQLENESLDAVTMWHVLEHIPNQDEILNLIAQKLKPNGLLVIAVPNHTSYDAKKYGEYWAAYDVPRHIYHFSKSGMERLMKNKKWNLKYTRPLLFDAFYISMLSEKYKKNPIFWLSGFIYGAISNFKAIKTGEFSSLIYVIRKNEKIDF